MTERSEEADTEDARPEEPADTTVEEPDEQPEPERFSYRRAPRYGPFGITGAVLGVLVGLVVGNLPAGDVPGAETYTGSSVLGYFVAIFGLIGVLVGLVLALLLERRRR